ncbi:hypothetical protein Rhow_004271 [Rhodococcus wratislaviensis]|uniref:Uncharacterized protein n=1 Tax=Rhodococcus wratislaviensis TaxID=44752 RepID=A0A402CAJ4_RHOWR|nr:hypothetical protein Rhow_004271 [Rhodococcus wratislaviensis]
MGCSTTAAGSSAGEMRRPSRISKILINGRELVPGRVTVVLIREAIGY